MIVKQHLIKFGKHIINFIVFLFKLLAKSFVFVTLGFVIILFLNMNNGND